MDAASKAYLTDQDLQIVAKQSGVLICRYDMKNHSLERFYDDTFQRFGISGIEENMPYSVLETNYVSEDTKENYAAFFQGMLDGIETGSAEIKLLDQTNHYQWFHTDYTLVYDDNHKPLHALITFYNITEKREIELASEKWRANLSSILADSILYAEINLSKNTVEKLKGDTSLIQEVQQVNDFESFTKLSIPKEMKIATIDENRFYEFLDRQRLLRLFYGNTNEDSFDYRLTRNQHEDTWIRINVKMMKYPYSTDVMAIIAFTDIDEQHKELEVLSHKAFYDTLTDLLNREGIQNKANEMLGNYNPSMMQAMFIIDLDDFKKVNDLLGHQSGDTVLTQTAEILRLCLRESDLVGRLGGDEFIILINGKMSVEQLETKALQILSSLKLQIMDKVNIQLSASIGVAFGRSKTTFDKLYRTADVALYTSKRTGKSKYHLINFDTNDEYSFTGVEKSTDLLSLQSLLDYADLEDQIGSTKSKTPYEAIIENIPGGVVYIELGDYVKVTQCNEWIYNFTGFSKKELADLESKHILVIVHPDDKDFVNQTIQNMYEGLNDINITFRMLHKNKDYKYVNLNASITERKSNRISFYGIYSDVNETMCLQKEIEESRRKIDTLIKSVPGGVCIFNIGETLKISHITDWIYEYTGYHNKDEMDDLRNGDQLHTVWPDDLAYVKQTLYEVRHFKDTVTCRFRIRHKDGYPIYVKMNGSVMMRDEKETVVYAIYTADSKV